MMAYHNDLSQNTHWKLQPESVWKNSPFSLDSNNLGQAQKVQRRMGEDWCLTLELLD